MCNLILLNYGNLRKIESYLFRNNLTNELKSYGPIPKGIVEFVFKNTPADLRSVEVSYLFYNAYGICRLAVNRSPSRYNKMLSMPRYILSMIINMNAICIYT